MITWLGSAFEDACLASVQDMHSCDNSVVQHCADPISTTHTVLAALEALAGGRSGPDSGLAGRAAAGRWWCTRGWRRCSTPGQASRSPKHAVKAIVV